MSKIIKMIFMVISIIGVVMLIGCGNQEKTQNSVDNENNSKPIVYTSFYPIYDFTSKIGGDKIEVINMVPAGTEPHDWEPTPRDMQNLTKADLLIYNGYGMEHWIDKVNDSIGSDKLKLIMATENVDLIGNPDTANDSSVDPHIWLSINNAIIEMENIKNALIELDSENAQYYDDNFNKYKAEFQDLDITFRDFTNSTQKKDIIVAHDAFAYLCRDYGLNQIAISGISADDEPEPTKMAEIVKFAKENDVKYIFFEELVSPKVAETIASESGAKTEVLNPLEGLTEEQINNGEDYISVMKKNFEAIKLALQ